MTVGYGLGMFAFSMVCLFTGSMIAWFIIKNITKKQNKKNWDDTA
jgi:hypothetical protein